VKLKKSAWSEEVSLVNLASTFVGAPNGETGERRTSSAKASARVQDPEVRTRAQGPEVQGTQPVGASNGEKTSTKASSDAEGMSMRGAETRVEDPEVQGIQKRG
jgi:hypothetical protein